MQYHSLQLCLPLCPTLLSMHTAVAAADAVDVQPASKKQKTAAAAADSGAAAAVIRQSLLSGDSRSQLRQQHDSSGPYTHLVLKELADEQLLRAVREEVIHNISATYKETDLFKVFQTGGGTRGRHRLQQRRRRNSTIAAMATI